MDYQGISIKRVAVGVQSDVDAPATYWNPPEQGGRLPDSMELSEMLREAQLRLVGDPEHVTVAILFEAPGVPGKQLNEKHTYEPELTERLDSIMRSVLAACLEDASQ